MTQTPSYRHLLLQYLPRARPLSHKSQGARRWCPARIKRNYGSRVGWGVGGVQLCLSGAVESRSHHYDRTPTVN